MVDLIEDWSSVRRPRMTQGLAGVLDLPEAPGPARDGLVLQHVQAGEAEVRWTTLQVGSRLRLAVMSDALKLGGVRVGAGAGLAQQVADVLGAMFLTPKVLDLMYLARQVTIEPMTQYSATEMLKTSWFVKESARIDAAIGSTIPDGIIQSVGKPWMITNGLLSHPGRACNYGWHVPPGSVSGTPPQWKQTPAYLSVTIPNVYVLQQPGYAHVLDEADYSEQILLMSKTCTVDGQETNLSDVLTDPTLSKIISHEGPLKLTRQPGVAPVAMMASGSPSTGGGSVAILGMLLAGAGAALLAL